MFHRELPRSSLAAAAQFPFPLVKPLALPFPATKIPTELGAGKSTPELAGHHRKTLGQSSPGKMRKDCSILPIFPRKKRGLWIFHSSHRSGRAPELERLAPWLGCTLVFLLSNEDQKIQGKTMKNSSSNSSSSHFILLHPLASSVIFRQILHPLLRSRVCLKIGLATGNQLGK